MEAFSKIKEVWQKHPYLIAGAIFIIGVFIIYLLFRKPAQQASGSSDVQAYYQAATAATASGNALQQTQVAAAASTQASNNALTATLAQIAAGTIASQEQTKQTQIVADASNINTQINATATNYTSLLGAFTAQQQIEGNVLQQAIGGITTASVSAPNAEQATIGTQSIGSVLSMVTPQINSAIDNPSALLAMRYIPGIDPNNLAHLSGTPLNADSLKTLGY